MGCNTISGTFDGFSAVATAMTGPGEALRTARNSLSSFKPSELFDEPRNCDLNGTETEDLGLLGFETFGKTRAF